MNEVQKKKRASTSRSRYGCPTCRTRHVKCDETKPSCLQCTSTGRKCDYAQPDTAYPIMSSTSDPVSTWPATSRPAQLVYAIPFKVPGSQKDRRILHYYCVQAAHDLSGFIPSNFWTTTLLQSSHREPVIRHTLVAFGSVKLAFETASHDNTSLSTNKDSLMHYNMAVRHVIRYISTHTAPPPLIVLQACVLLYYFDIMRGDHQAALVHLDNGLAILHNLSLPTVPQSGTGFSSAYHGEIREMEAILLRMDLQATFFDDARILKYRPYNINLTSVDVRFTSVEAAHIHLDLIMNHIWTLLTENLQYKRTPLETIPLGILKQKQILRAELQTWQTASERLRVDMAAEDPMRFEDSDKKTSLDLLTLLYTANHLLLQSSLPEDLTIFTKSPNRPVEHVLDLAETLVLRAGPAAGRNCCRVFSAEIGVLAPLFLVAMKCSDPLLTSRATDLLARCSRREGLYDAGMIMNMIQTIQKRGGLDLDRVDDAEDLDADCSVANHTYVTVPPRPSLEMVAPEIADITGGLGVMAEMLGLENDFKGYAIKDDG